MSTTLPIIRSNVLAGRIRVSQHGMQELSDDSILLPEVIASLASASVVEDYPEYAKGPCVLCLQTDGQGDAIHVLWGLAAQCPNIATIITAYRPDPERWMDDLRRGSR
ncbi:MAG: DUF4258 domain-containing protein, partial [Hyphomicrobium sp.]|nr:DUF4258 domain-containing protein [Hyphomicrobium sp.]